MQFKVHIERITFFRVKTMIKVNLFFREIKHNDNNSTLLWKVKINDSLTHDKCCKAFDCTLPSVIQIYLFFVPGLSWVCSPSYRLCLLYVQFWQDTGIRTRDAATAARCATNELHTTLSYTHPYELHTSLSNPYPFKVISWRFKIRLEKTLFCHFFGPQLYTHTI